ncbi:MAG: LysM peptidoglycan-binding domain-containing protein [Candidatus Thiothrix sulfatifontis]|nr:MAG: LysM peptidoglycan-binding domain-containing protein [Candidatus Thiothrix sulfatifontis]
MFADNFLIEKVRLGQSFLLACAMTSGATLAAEDTYNCVPLKGGSSPTDSAYFDQIIANQLAISPPTAPASSSPSAADNFYIVQKGDTLYAIMRKSGVPIKNLIVLNQLPSLNNLKEGQPLKLFDLPNTAQPRKTPDKEMLPMANVSSAEAAVDRYVVKVGETLYAISRQTGVSIERLVSLNQLTASNNINAGQQLRLR